MRPLNFGAARLASVKAPFTSCWAWRKTIVSGESLREISRGEIARDSNLRAGSASPRDDRRAAFSRVVASRSADKPCALFAEVSSAKGARSPTSLSSEIAAIHSRSETSAIAFAHQNAISPEVGHGST